MESSLLLTKLENLMSAFNEIKDIEELDTDCKKAVKDFGKNFKDVTKYMKEIRKEVHGHKKRA
jgi:hypothetical protein